MVSQCSVCEYWKNVFDGVFVVATHSTLYNRPVTIKEETEKACLNFYYIQYVH